MPAQNRARRTASRNAARSPSPSTSPSKSGHGGARAGAGRPARGPIASEPHQTRPTLSARHPVRITARVVRAVGELRRRRAYQAIRRAVHTALGRTDFRIIDLELRAARIELIVEADHRIALARGMQSFQIAAARQLNRALGRRGTVFPDRYRARVLATRRAVRTALADLPARERTCSPRTWLLIFDRPRRRRRRISGRRRTRSPAPA